MAEVTDAKLEKITGKTNRQCPSLSDKELDGEEARALTAPESGGATRTRRWGVLAAMLVGTTLATLDSSILNISVVPMMAEFRVELHTLEWVLTSYNVVFAAFMIGFGTLGDVAGRRRLYVAGQLVFVLGSLLAVFADRPAQLVVFRALQGLGAAALAPNALAIILDIFPEGERGAALGVWGAAAGLGGALGPTVGGVLVEAWGWRSVFGLNLPVGLLVASVAYWLLVPDPPRRLRGFDVQGFAALTAALLALSFAAASGSRSMGPWSRAGAVALALLCGWWFAIVERRAKEPLVDLGAILRPRVVVANVTAFFALLVMAGGMFLSVLYVQLLAETSPATVGLLLAPCAAATFVLAPLAGYLAGKIGPRSLGVAGVTALGASVALPLVWHPASPAALVLSSNLIAGAGLGLALPALVRVATESVPHARAGMGAGVYKTVNELGGVFGIVLVGTLLEARIVATALQRIPRHFLPQELSLNAVASLKTLEVHALQKGLAAGEVDTFHRALTAAVQRGFDQVFAIAAILAGLGVAACLLMPRRLREASDEARS